ncbi:MAG: ORF6N domain-containing protein [Patescibacteria group bacterium]
MTDIIPIESIEMKILIIRGQKVILDSDLAELYGVTTARLNEQVKRNRSRFPEDFVFRLNKNEFDNLISHFATSRLKWGGRRKLPLVFTEHGAVMAANVLSSPRAVAVSIQVVRTFVRLREILATHKDLARKLAELEEKYDEQFAVVFEAIRQLMTPVEPEKKGKIGFRLE